MTDHTQLAAMMRVEEGERPGFYLCSARKLTIGIGHNMEANPLTGKQWRELFDAGEVGISITPKGQARMLKWDVDVAERQLSLRLDGWNILNDARQNVLISMVFQIGIDGVMEFRQMLNHIRMQQWDKAALAGLDSKWARTDSPARAKRAMRQLETGVYAA